jgi:NAD(P)-dependent dehydrogenase (short-subunit alcohol dehydrogenase family)
LQLELHVTEHRNDIAGKVVVVTGAAGGIGRCLVSALVKAGASEVIAVMRKAEMAQSAIVRPVSLDITDAAAVDAFGRSLASPASILINNAGFNANSGALSAPTVDSARREMEVNYFGTLNMIRAVAPAMRRQGRGVIVNILTVMSHVNLPLMGSYCASKAAAYSLTQAARAELAASGVRVLGVFPGAVDTAMSSRVPPPKLSPDEVAEAAIGLINSDGEDCYPGEVAQRLRAAIQADMKAVERQLALRLPSAG